MNPLRRRLLAALGAAVALGGASVAWYSRDRHHYLDGDAAAFAAAFPAPPAADSPRARAEIEQLVELQRTRTDAEVKLAQADRKTRISRFYATLEIPDSARMPALEKLAQNVEDDIRPYVRAAKERFRRLRPYEIDTRLQPCIEDVRGDLSFPSGHAAYGYAMAHLLSDLVPERREQLMARARQFARQRMVCGVHFQSDIEAGSAAAESLMNLIRANPRYREDMLRAAAELRPALKLPPLP